MTQAGYPFLFGFYGTRVTRETVSLFTSTGACGVLLLARNIESPRQLKRLCAELVQRVGRPLLFSIDHEGGWVTRFTSGVTFFPGNAALGAAGDERLAHDTGAHMALELRALGVQLNLAPVLDVVTPRHNPGIGIRSFGQDAALVGRLGAAFTRGLQSRGVWACAKHFPGKGAAAVDAHVELPTIRLPKAEFERTHLAPFAAAVRAGAACVMTSHVRYPALDEKRIATFSPAITRDILRKKLGFDGVVVSDDLCMGAISTREPIQLAAARAMAAGHDLLIVAHDRGVMLESADMLAAALDSGDISRAEFERSCRRIRRLFNPPRPGPAPRGDASDVADETAARAVKLLRQGETALPLDGRALYVLPDFREVKERFAFEDGPEGPRRWLERRVAGRVALSPVESKDASKLARALAAAERVVFLCFEAKRFPGQRAALELINRRAAGKTVAALIRGRWDLELLSPRITALDANGYRRPQLAAILDRIAP